MLSSSSPMIEALKLVTVKIESVSDSISTIEVPASMWLIDCVLTILTTFYHMFH